MNEQPNAARLLDYLAEIESELYEFPAIDAASFRRAVEEAINPYSFARKVADEDRLTPFTVIQQQLAGVTISLTPWL